MMSAPALRYKSLPDLFAGSLPKKTAAPEAVPLPVPAAAPKKDKEPPKKIRKNGHCPSFVGLSTKEKSISHFKMAGTDGDVCCR